MEKIPNYKGIFDFNETRKQFYEGGAHFKYIDLVNSLESILKEKPDKDKNLKRKKKRRSRNLNSIGFKYKTNKSIINILSQQNMTSNIKKNDIDNSYTLNLNEDANSKSLQRILSNSNNLKFNIRNDIPKIPTQLSSEIKQEEEVFQFKLKHLRERIKEKLKNIKVHKENNLYTNKSSQKDCPVLPIIESYYHDHLIKKENSSSKKLTLSKNSEKKNLLIPYFNYISSKKILKESILIQNSLTGREEMKSVTNVISDNTFIDHCIDEEDDPYILSRKNNFIEKKQKLKILFIKNEKSNMTNSRNRVEDL